jgi:hypothetical protein
VRADPSQHYLEEGFKMHKTWLHRVGVAATVLGCALALSAPALAGGNLTQMVDDQRAAGAAFTRVAPFAAGRSVGASSAEMRGVLREGTVLSLDRRALAELGRTRPETMTLTLPYGRSTVALELVRVNPFTPDFEAVTSEGIVVDENAYGVHYRGVVRGEKDSMAAISVYGREIMGLAASPSHGQLVLGRIAGENPRNEHVLYPTVALVPQHRWSCDTVSSADAGPTMDEFIASLDSYQSSVEGMAVEAAGDCVRIYVESDYDIYQHFGSAAAVTNYLTGLFNQSAALYNADGVTISMSQLLVWTTRSPYSGNSSSALLSSFQRKRKSFNGDLGHLVALRGGGGIAAGFNGLCASKRSDSQCFSGIDTSYQNIPTYSWSVMVFTHEMGHLMGSRHTHACVWNGNNTQIDGCYTPEGTCANVGYPSGGGTIMSYCHLSGRPGINFNNGFGPQPKGVILNRINGAACLNTCP